jgi:peptidyl-prolyl cis-trans isomerase SurA
MNKLLPIPRALSCLGTALLLAAAPPAAHAQLRVSPGLAAPRISAPDARQQSADYIVAIVNSEPITNNQVRSRVLRFEQQLSQQGGAMPPRNELLSQMLERLILERAQVQLARDSGIRIDETSLDNAVLGIARQNQLASVDELRRRMQSEGVDYAQFRTGIRDDLLLQRLREREVESRVNITEAELTDYIREQKATPDISTLELNLAQVLVIVPENASAAQISAAQDKATRALQRARAGENFAALVRELSDADARNKEFGGEFGMRPADRYPQIFVDATQNLKVGDIAAVRSEAGFHVLKVIERRQSSMLPDSVVQTRARHILLRTSAGGSEAASVNQLNALRQRIARGEISFEAAARSTSQDGSAREGGDLGWANPGQFVPEFEETMNALPIGQVSEPVVSRFGVHLIQVAERRDRKLTEREQRDAARGLLRERKLDEAFVTWSQEVRGRAYVEMREPPR